MAREHQIRILFESSLLRVEDVHCRGSRPGKQPEEWTVQHEIAIPRSGAFIRHDASGNNLVDPSQILFFNRGDPYQVSHPILGGDRSTVFILQAHLLAELLESFDPTIMDRLGRPFPVHHIVLDSRLQLLQYWLLNTTAEEAGAPSSLQDALAVEEKILLLLGEVLHRALLYARRESAKLSHSTRREHTDLAEHVKHVLSNRFQEKITLEEIARTVHSSPYHLCRVFKGHTGLPIHLYLKRLRLLRSLDKMAEQPEEPFSNIALELGFSSHNHFTAAFREAFDLSPSEFRRSITSRRVREMSKILKA